MAASTSSSTAPAPRGWQIFIAAGGFVGRFDRQTPAILGYRDHNDSPPWSVDEIHAMIAEN